MKVPVKVPVDIVADIGYDIVEDIVSDIVSDILPDDIVPVGSCSGNDDHHVKGVALRFWSSVEQVALPFKLDAAKGVQVAVRSANEIASDDCIQLGGGPQVSLLRRDAQLVAHVGTDPLRQLGTMSSAKRR